MSILDSFSLDGKVAIVTGASSGLGVAFAKGLAEAGADVAICARRVDKLEATRKAIEEIEAAGGPWTFAKLTIANAALRELANAEAAKG